MYKLLFLLFITLLNLSVTASDFFPEKKAISSIKKALKVKSVELIGEVEIPDELISTDACVIYQFKQVDDNSAYYAVFKEAMGRHDKFDYVMITNKDCKVQKVMVVRYRSEYGSEIASKKWLSQFIDFNGGTLRYGSDISAISGATVSAKSITSDIPLTLEVLKKSLQKVDLLN